MKLGLLSLPAELRQKIISYVYEPNVIFYFRKDSLNSNLFSLPGLYYEIGPIRKSFLQIDPTLSEDFKVAAALINPNIKKIIDDTLTNSGEVPASNWQEPDWNKRLFSNPSPDFLQIVKRARFVLDLTSIEANFAIARIESNRGFVRFITYLAVRSMDDFLFGRILRHFTNLETLALFCSSHGGPTLPTWAYQRSCRARVAHVNVQHGRTAAFSRLEYMFGVEDRGLSAYLVDPETEEVSTNYRYSRRQMGEEELDDRGHVRFFHDDDNGYGNNLRDDMVVVYEFLTHNA
ncbi:hypothetical protein TWF694_007854 [Orbilia ellipsospora]|uniref:F-box domain-containing protein n=1 Tax=Orbilia ellipsospora TaxID=2528407 RepID=A0AAV9XJX9_9PEZI